jgi:SAM-dependent methyltransferase
MNLKLIKDKQYDEIMKLDFDIRHGEAYKKQYGVFRWKGIYEYKDYLLKQLLDPENRTVLDLGGSLSPLGFGSTIIDILEQDLFGRPVMYNNILQYDGTADIIFSSHMLEHTHNPMGELSAWKDKLKLGGLLILHVPSIHGIQYWHPLVKAEHQWIFMLGGENKYKAMTESRIMSIDKVVGEEFRLEWAKYCGDNSIFLVARNV